MNKLLFVCTENKLRSATAESVLSVFENIEAIGAGTNKDSECPISGDLIEWADIIFVMENTHKRKVSSKFGQLLQGKKLICLDIKDNYEYMQPELIAILKRDIQKYVSLPSADT